MGFFTDVIDHLKFNVFNKKDPELAKRMKLKAVKAELKKQKHQFIDFKDKTLTPSFAEYIYGIYRILNPIAKLMKDEFGSKKGALFSAYLIERALGEEEKTLLAGFTREMMVDAIMKQNDVNGVFNQVKANFKTIQQSLSNEKATEINITFQRVKAFAEIFNFDFFLFLKTFDTAFPETFSLDYRPRFTPAESRYLVDDLVKLDSAIMAIEPDKTTIDALIVYEEYRNAPKTNEKNAKKLIGSLRYLQSSGILHDMIVYLLADFSYVPSVARQNDNVVGAYMNELAKQLKKDMESIVQQLRDDRVTKIKDRVFQGMDIARMEHYSADTASDLRAAQCASFSYVDAIQYLKTFVIEKYERSYKEICNQLILHSEFTEKSMQTTLTDAFYALNETREKILKLDARASESGDEGRRLKMLLLTIRKSKGNADLIGRIVTTLDAEAFTLLRAALDALKAIHSLIVGIANDIEKKTKSTIFNSQAFASGQHAKMLLEAKKMAGEIALFLTLMQNFVR